MKFASNTSMLYLLCDLVENKVIAVALHTMFFVCLFCFFETGLWIAKVQSGPLRMILYL